jgi:hypothetical protein
MEKVKNDKMHFLDVISPQDAVHILRALYAESNEMAGKIERVAEKHLGEVDIEGIADDVYSALDALEVEELWDRSGPQHDGYSEPGEMACEMMDEELAPFQADMRKYQKLGKSEEAKLYWACCEMNPF